MKEISHIVSKQISRSEPKSFIHTKSLCESLGIIKAEIISEPYLFMIARLQSLPDTIIVTYQISEL